MSVLENKQNDWGFFSSFFSPHFLGITCVLIKIMITSRFFRWLIGPDYRIPWKNTNPFRKLKRFDFLARIKRLRWKWTEKNWKLLKKVRFDSIQRLICRVYQHTSKTLKSITMQHLVIRCIYVCLISRPPGLSYVQWKKLIFLF